MEKSTLSPPRVRGFTLIELAVVLAVVSILAAVVVPDFIEVARNDLAQQASSEMTMVLDTAKWYYTNSGTLTGGAFDPGAMRWPGDYDADGTQEGSPGDCLTGAGPASILGFPVNCHIAYIPATSLQNPWGQAYDMNLVPPILGFNVRTNVPESVTGVVRSFVPGGECESGFNGGTNPRYCPALNPRPAGYATCCATIPRPGREASFELMSEQLTPDSGSGVTCEERYPDCLDGEVSRGIVCNGKNCENPRVRCCTVVDDG